jgi:hypothetical protein
MNDQNEKANHRSSLAITTATIIWTILGLLFVFASLAMLILVLDGNQSYSIHYLGMYCGILFVGAYLLGSSFAINKGQVNKYEYWFMSWVSLAITSLFVFLVCRNVIMDTAWLRNESSAVLWILVTIVAFLFGVATVGAFAGSHQYLKSPIVKRCDFDVDDYDDSERTLHLISSRSSDRERRAEFSEWADPPRLLFWCGVVWTLYAMCLFLAGAAYSCYTIFYSFTFFLTEWFLQAIPILTSGTIVTMSGIILFWFGIRSVTLKLKNPSLASGVSFAIGMMLSILFMRQLFCALFTKTPPIEQLQIGFFLSLLSLPLFIAGYLVLTEKKKILAWKGAKPKVRNSMSQVRKDFDDEIVKG